MGDVYTNPPQSRNEAILRATIDGIEYTDPPQSRIEDLLLQLKAAIEEGGGTGEGDMKRSVYDPDRTVAQAGGIEAYVTDELSTKADKSTVDDILDGTSIDSFADVETALADKMSYADNGVLGAKNLLPAILSITKALNNSGTWSNNVYSHNGVNYTLTEENGYITKIKVNGTATDLSVLRLYNGIKSLVGGRYILSGCPEGGSTSTYYLQGYRVESADGQSGSVQDTGNGVEFDYLNIVTNDNFSIIVLKNTTVNNADYYPILRLATDSDPTYHPYAETNRELTVNKADNSVIAPIENGTNASQAYAVGSHAIRNGKFITWKNAKAQNEPIADSDYTSGDVADIFNAHVMVALTSNTDLNNLTLSDLEYEKVFYATSTVASTLSNVPFSGSGFRLELKRMAVGADRLIQICYANVAETQDIYYRIKTASGWRNWKQIQYVL